MIFAIDPGTTQSGWVLFDGDTVINCGITENNALLEIMSKEIPDHQAKVAIEMIASYGMAVGASVLKLVFGLEDSTRRHTG